MLEMGKTYSTFGGKRSFTIIGKKLKSPTGFFWIGECTRTSLVAYFNHEGHHAHQSELHLDCDPYLYMPINTDNSMAFPKFLKREAIPDLSYKGYLRINKYVDTFHGISFVSSIRKL